MVLTWEDLLSLSQAKESDLIQIVVTKKNYGDEKEMDLHSVWLCARRRRSP